MTDIFEVEFVDLDRIIEVPADRPILETAEDRGLDLPYQCRMGICGVCSALRVEEGEVEQRDGMFLSASEKDEGYVLTCIAKPRSDLRLRSNSGP